MGYTVPPPPPVLAKDLGLCSQKPAEIWGQWLPRQERKRKQGPPFFSLLFPPPSTSPSLWVLNAAGEQRVLSEKARGWDRVGAAGTRPGLPHLSFTVAAGAGRAPSHQGCPFPQLPRCPSGPLGDGLRVRPCSVAEMQGRRDSRRNEP